MHTRKSPPSPPKSPPKAAAAPTVEMPAQHQHRGLGRFIPYFRNPENILRTKLNLFLLLWMFIAGIMKEMDQSATTQAYVSGMREDLGLFGNELNWFQTYFSIAYAIFIVPSQMLQTKLRPSLWLPFAEVTWGLFTLFWQWLFIVSGGITILLGLLGLFIVPDSPPNTQAAWLTATDKHISRERMERHNIQPARLIPWRVLGTQLVLLLRHPLTWMFMAVFAQNAWAGRTNSYILLYLKGVTDGAIGRPLYSTYQVSLIPLGGYALQILTNVGINALGDYKGWRWQTCVGSGLVHIAACAILASWPARHAVIMFAYFLTYTTSASGPAVIAWLAELLRAETEARSIIVGLTVTVVYVGHAVGGMEGHIQSAVPDRIPFCGGFWSVRYSFRAADTILVCEELSRVSTPWL